MKKNKRYDVYVKVNVETVVSINAASYEEALQKARELGVKDVVEFETEFNDGDISVKGIFSEQELAHK